MQFAIKIFEFDYWAGRCSIITRKRLWQAYNVRQPIYYTRFLQIFHPFNIKRIHLPYKLYSYCEVCVNLRTDRHQVRVLQWSDSRIIIPLHYSVLIDDTINKLRFVSCGKRGVSPFLFEQLVSVFDIYIGICFFATLFVLAEVQRRYFIAGKMNFLEALVDKARLFLD